MILDEDGETKFEDGLEALRADIQRAQNEGNSERAARLYQKEMAMLASKHGNRPVVGGGGRTV